MLKRESVFKTLAFSIKNIAQTYGGQIVKVKFGKLKKYKKLGTI